MISSSFFPIENENIFVQEFITHSSECVFWLHGAGNSSSEYFVPCARFLQKQGIASVAFDYSGHGKSTNHTLSSLSKKTIQAKMIFENFVQKYDKIHIFAFSMSGQIAINLLEIVPRIHSLALFSPALYSEDFFDIPFDERFTQTISQKGNWNQSNISRVLSYFWGKIVLVRPQYDPVIPVEVFDMYRKFSPIGYFSEIIVPNAPHTLAKWMHEDISRFEAIFHSLQEYFSQK